MAAQPQQYDMNKTVSEEVEYILIGAGLPRTGTFSTFTALEQVLPGRCHHMARAMSSSSESEFWTRASRGDLTDQDWRDFIRSGKLCASVDYPMSLYWRDLARLYPKAKVLLTVRDPVRWYLSVKNSIREFIRFVEETWMAAPFRLISSLTGHNRTAAIFASFGPTYLGPRYPRGMFGAVDSGQETAVRFFTEWVEQVKREVPAERLLVFEVKDGWDPLCQFLGVPVPETQFPNVNDTAEIQRSIRQVKRFCWMCWGVGIAGAAVTGYYFRDQLDLSRIQDLLSKN